MAKVKKEKNNPVEEFFKAYSNTDEEINFQFGDAVFETVTDVISTSSLVLDDALSAGGLPRGRLMQFYGKSASGKTLLAMLSIKSAQQADPDAIQFFLDAEQTFNYEWAKQLGLDTSKICIVRGETATYGQKLFELLLGIPKADQKHRFVGKSKEGLLDKIAKGEMNVNMIILDSLGAVIPPGIDTAAVGQVTMGKGAKFYTETFAKLSLEVSKANVCFIVINHVKASMDPYGPDHTFSGGNSYTHHLSANVYFSMSNAKDKAIADENEEKIGGTIIAKVEKSKFGPHPKTCEFKVNFYTGVVDLETQILDLSCKYKVIIRPNIRSYEYDGNKWGSRAEMLEYLQTNPSVCEELKKKIARARAEKGNSQPEAPTKIEQSSEEESEED